VDVLRTLDPIYLNARADECLAVTKDRGVRTVRYQAGLYTVIGYFLAFHAGERVLYYILRPALGTNGALGRPDNSASYATPGNT
jgi:hypothetical protein